MSVRGDTSGEEPGLGTLLEVLHGAGSFSTIQASTSSVYRSAPLPSWCSSNALGGPGMSAWALSATRTTRASAAGSVNSCRSCLVLLRAVALHGGEPFHEITTVEIAFDEPIGDDLFRFEPPAGEQVQPVGQRARPHHITATEAQQRAPFTVLIPERIPANWHVHCVFIEPSQRPPRPASVSLNYRSDDGHESVSLSQYGASNKPEQYDLMIASDGWRTITHDGNAVQVRRGGPQSQAHIESDGTFVFLTSETLSGDQLAAIAAGLKPASGETIT